MAFSLAQALTKCHPLYSLHRFHLPQNNLMPASGDLILTSSSYRPEISFPEGMFLRCVCFFLFFFFLMFAGTLSLERLDGSQPNFHTRWRGGLAHRLAAILEPLLRLNH